MTIISLALFKLDVHTFTLQTAIKKLTFESVAQILRSVDLLHTARLSLGVLESPAERLEVSTEKTCLCESRSRGERSGEERGRGGVPACKNTRLRSTDLLLRLKTSDPEKCHNSRSALSEVSNSFYLK